MYYYLLGVIPGLERREGSPCNWLERLGGQDRWERCEVDLDEVGDSLRRLGEKKTYGKGGAARSRHAGQASAWVRTPGRRGAGGRTANMNIALLRRPHMLPLEVRYATN